MSYVNSPDYDAIIAHYLSIPSKVFDGLMDESHKGVISVIDEEIVVIVLYTFILGTFFLIFIIAFSFYLSSGFSEKLRCCQFLLTVIPLEK